MAQPGQDGGEGLKPLDPFVRNQDAHALPALTLARRPAGRGEPRARPTVRFT
jgi:hypothetical protein